MQTIIVRYDGALKSKTESTFIGSQVVELFNQYAIVTIQDEDMAAFAALPEVEYVERPKRLYFDVEEGRRVSCIDSVQGTVGENNSGDYGISAGVVQMGGGGLSGKGVLVGIIDSGERVIILSSYFQHFVL